MEISQFKKKFSVKIKSLSIVSHWRDSDEMSYSIVINKQNIALVIKRHISIALQQSGVNECICQVLF